MFKEMTDAELLDFCEDTFCQYAVCQALKCEDDCKDEDCPLWQLFERFNKKVAIVPDINVGDKVEWISVEERLPEKYKDVLCYGNGHSFFVDFICSDGTWCDDHIDKITHWMPLPEAPKMRKEDEGK